MPTIIRLLADMAGSVVLFAGKGVDMLAESNEIARLRVELKRDLEALERVEKLLARRSLKTKDLNHGSSPNNGGKFERRTRAALRDLVMDILQHAKKPLRPHQIVDIAAHRGYPFASVRKGMGTVTSVLARNRGKGHIEKLADGSYIWNA